jgi:hypothetical protein
MVPVSKEENEKNLLLALAGSIDSTGKTRPLNVSQIKAAAHIKGRQTALNLVSQLRRAGWLETRIHQWRKHRNARYYALNEIGLQAVKNLYPEKFGGKPTSLTPEQSHIIDLKALDFVLDSFRHAMIRGKSPACSYEWVLIMTSDERGQLSCRLKSRELQKRKEPEKNWLSYSPTALLQPTEKYQHKASPDPELERKIRRQLGLT